MHPATHIEGSIPLPGLESAAPESGGMVEPLFAHNPLPMWMYDPTTLRFVEVNRAAIDRYGYSREEFLRMTIVDIAPSQDVPALVRDLSRSIAHIKQGVTSRHRYANGEIRTVEVDANRITFQGRELVLVGVHDLTERIGVEEALRRSEARYRDLIENANDIIYVHDLEGNMLSVNAAAERLTGWTRGEIKNRKLMEFVAPEFLARVFGAIEQKISSSDSNTTYEIEVVTKDGSRLPLEVSTKLVVVDGEAVAVEGVARDITERKRSQEMIRRQSDRAEALAMVSRAIAEARLDLSSILDSVAGLASGLIGDACVIRLLSDDGTRLDAAAVRHPNPGAVAVVEEISRRAPHPATEGLYARMLEAGGPVLLVEVDPDADMPSSMRPHYEEYIRRFGISSIVAAPLIVQDAIIGSITMTRDRGGKAYTKEDEFFLVQLADRAAIAIANARLFDMTRARLKQVQALRRIDTSIIGTLDVGMTLDFIIEQIRSELAVDAAAVLLFEPATSTLSYSAGTGFGTGVRDSSFEWQRGTLAKVVLDREMTVDHEVATNSSFQRRTLAAREGFVTHIAVPLVARNETKGVLELFQRSRYEPTSAWREFLQALATQAAIAIDNAQLFADLQRANIEQVLAYETTLEGWSRALDLRDQETEGHSSRVAHITSRLARALGLSGEDLVNIRRGALLHDIGKMGIPDAILRKPGPLTDDEWEVMRRHPVYAYDLLAPTRFLRPVLDVPYSHHERWDGSGYPRGLSGEEIPLSARIFAIVDVYDALRSERTYRRAFSEDQAREFLGDHAGKLFDPELTKLFLATEI